MTPEQLIHLGFSIALEWVTDDLDIELSSTTLDSVVTASIPKEDYAKEGTPLLHRTLKELYNDIIS